MKHEIGTRWIHELSDEDFEKAYAALKKAHVPGPYKAIQSIDAGMSLEAPRKPVDALNESGSYPTSGEGVKRTSEAVKPFTKEELFKMGGGPGKLKKD